MEQGEEKATASREGRRGREARGGSEEPRDARRQQRAEHRACECVEHGGAHVGAVPAELRGERQVEP